MTAISFAAPYLLAGFISLPLLWWLLRATPPAPQHTQFGGMFFLRKLINNKDTPAKTPWWLLLIRLCAIALTIIALAGPILNAPKADTGTVRPLLLIVDDSWPAAPTWRERQTFVRDLALAEQSRSAQERDRIVRFLSTAGVPVLSDPIPLDEVAAKLDSMPPQASLPNRSAVLDALAPLGDIDQWEVLWISDGLVGRTGADREFLRTMGKAGRLKLFRTPITPPLVLTDLKTAGTAFDATVTRIGGGERDGTLVATARDGRVVSSIPFSIPADASSINVPIELPLALRNEVTQLTLTAQPHAGAKWLLDASAKRVRAGLVTEADDTLLDGGFYISQALEPRAALVVGDVETLATPETGLIILDDLGTLRHRDTQTLVRWVSNGGVLLRFAGPNTANAAGVQGRERDPTYPVALRGGERSFGGALTWEAPQPVGSFSPTSPLADVPVPADVTIRRQVLTRAGGDGDDEVWASLADGTPLVTARREGSGLLVLVHVTATPTWSDLPLSGAFPAIIDRIVRMAAGAAPQQPARPLAPLKLLDGYGTLQDPPLAAGLASPADLTAGRVPPGRYGDAEAGYVVNTYANGRPTLDPLTAARLPTNATLLGPSEVNVRALGSTLLAVALVLFLLDGVIMIFSRWREGSKSRRTAQKVVSIALFTSALTLSSGSLERSFAQDLDLRPDLDQQAVAAALSTRFAYVRTGNARQDRLAAAGLSGLTRETLRRSALEPAQPVGVDIDLDDLSVYPLLYWSVNENNTTPTDSALSRLEAFMAGGGLLIIDTHDGERQLGQAITPAGMTLRPILRRMNIPPLEPLPSGHILTKSFYRLDDLHGRNTGGPIWVEAPSALRESTDGVPSLIISGRDWASAWAVDEGGRPLLPAGPGGDARREYAFRAGINMAMVAFTGNYKGDQVHVQELLNRIGNEGDQQ
ncbi:MAG: DUF4159 domain-containing protein [Pseudomonadota bacterium]